MRDLIGEDQDGVQSGNPVRKTCGCLVEHVKSDTEAFGFIPVASAQSFHYSDQCDAHETSFIMMIVIINTLTF
jgi:hypothetical protein